MDLKISKKTLMNKNFNKKLHKMLRIYLIKINSISLLYFFIAFILGILNKIEDFIRDPTAERKLVEFSPA